MVTCSFCTYSVQYKNRNPVDGLKHPLHIQSDLINLNECFKYYFIFTYFTLRLSTCIFKSESEKKNGFLFVLRINKQAVQITFFFVLRVMNDCQAH